MHRDMVRHLNEAGEAHRRTGNHFLCCDSCAHFDDPDGDGIGWCRAGLGKGQVTDGYYCSAHTTERPRYNPEIDKGRVRECLYQLDRYMNGNPKDSTDARLALKNLNDAMGRLLERG
jgi:hypothetical protein